MEKAGSFSSRDRERIAEELVQQLGPEYTSIRSGETGKQILYIEGNKVIQLANEIFGFDGWNSEIKELKDTTKSETDDKGRFTCSASCVMRITLKDGTYKEDVGFGLCTNPNSRDKALENAYKEASTDAMKRAFRQLGQVLGNCLSDRDYTQSVRGVTCRKTEFDVLNLRRPKRGLYNSSSSRVKQFKSDVPDVPDQFKAGPPALEADQQPQVKQEAKEQQLLIPSSPDLNGELDFLNDSKGRAEMPLLMSATSLLHNVPLDFDPTVESPGAHTLPQNRSGKVYRRQ